MIWQPCSAEMIAELIGEECFAIRDISCDSIIILRLQSYYKKVKCGKI